MPVREPARVIAIDGSLSSHQAVVGGMIENVGRMRLVLEGSRIITTWCNAEGYAVLPINRLVLLPRFAGEVYGPILLTATNDATGETYSLTDDEIEVCLSIVARWPQLGQTDAKGPA